MTQTTVCGVGTNNRGKFKTRENGKITPAYHCWANMLKRCYNPADTGYHQYGALGVYVCEPWLEFQTFAEWFYAQDWAGKRIDKDLKGGKCYSPETCQMITNQENVEAAIAKTYKFVSPQGDTVEIYNLHKFCKEHGLNSSTMCQVNVGKRNHHKGWKKYGT